MTTPEKMSAEDFIGKIHTEGGILDALDYGLSTNDYDLPEDVKVAWQKCIGAFADLDELMDDFQATVEENGLEFE